VPLLKQPDANSFEELLDEKNEGIAQHAYPIHELS
jgi:hypothetical protein